MEYTINIPQNTYKVPTEIRPEVVQAICEAFLNNNAFSTYHPYRDIGYRVATNYVVKGWYGYGFMETYSPKDEVYFKIRGCEMREAFKALRSAGWHIFKGYGYGSWLTYKVSDKPFMKDYTEVYEFTDFID